MVGGVFRRSAFAQRVAWLLRGVLFVLAVVTPIMVIYEFGYPITSEVQTMIHTAYRGMLTLDWGILTLLYVLGIGLEGRPSILAHSVARTSIYVVVSAIVLLHLSLALGWLQPDWLLSALTGDVSVRIALLVLSVAYISREVTGFLGRRTNPSLIMASSFAVIIVIGALILMLPRCTYSGIEWLDSIFVATSAVCVTGLSAVDIPSTFTLTGQVVVLILIQIGGLGVMTITSFFGLFFTGGRSISGQMVVGDILSTGRLSSLLKTIVKIITVTFFIEAVGAVFIYTSIHNADIGMSSGEALFFAIFHAVSAFCNAGFSTLSGNLADPVIASLSSIRWVVSLLIIFGGIGFPIFSNFLSIIAHKFRNLLRRIYGIRPMVHPHLWSLNSFIVVRMTLLLVLGAYGLFLLLEWNNTLAGMNLMEKLSQGFLMAVTPRTAGFSGVALSNMLPASIILTIALMWIGGAPQSTAGGVKVTTFYVAIKNIFSSTSGSGRIESHKRTIPSSSVGRAFGVIFLSITIITMGVMLMSVFDPNIEIIKLLYEVVSAISTVGLSLDTTPLLSDGSKIVLILLMFVGRVGLVALLQVFFRRNTPAKPYALPEESILIT